MVHGAMPRHFGDITFIEYMLHKEIVFCAGVMMIVLSDECSLHQRRSEIDDAALDN